MSICPICEADEYDSESGCDECGHYDEDAAARRRHGRRKTQQRQYRRRDRRLST